MVVQRSGRRHLLEHALAQHGDALAEGHRLLLIVRHVHHRRAQAMVQLDELGARLAAELRVEIRQRLVEQKRLRLPDDGAAHGDALALAAGELGRPSVEQVADAE